MAKLMETLGAAVLDVEGDGAAIAVSQRMFHRAVAEHALRDVEEKLAALRPLQKSRRELIKLIASLKRADELPPAAGAVDPVAPDQQKPITRV